jgi:hypothetical protein
VLFGKKALRKEKLTSIFPQKGKMRIDALDDLHPIFQLRAHVGWGWKLLIAKD